MCPAEGWHSPVSVRLHWLERAQSPRTDVTCVQAPRTWLRGRDHAHRHRITCRCKHNAPCPNGAQFRHFLCNNCCKLCRWHRNLAQHRCKLPRPQDSPQTGCRRRTKGRERVGMHAARAPSREVSSLDPSVTTMRPKRGLDHCSLQTCTRLRAVARGNARGADAKRVRASGCASVGQRAVSSVGRSPGLAFDDRQLLVGSNPGVFAQDPEAFHR